MSLRKITETSLQQASAATPHVLETIEELRSQHASLEVQNEALRSVQLESEAAQLRHFDFYDMAPVGYCTVDSAGLLLESNLTTARLLGLERAVVHQRRFLDCVIAADRPTYQGMKSRLLKTGLVQSCELQLAHPMRGPLWVLVIATMASSDLGAPVLRMVLNDIRARKLIEAEVQDARDYAEGIVETVREPLLVLDSKLRVLSANPSFYNAFKVTPQETVGQFIYDLGDRQWDIPKLRILFEEILPASCVFNGYEVEHDFPGVGVKTMVLNAREIFRKGADSRIILLAIEDITEQKRAENALKASEAFKEVILDSIASQIAVIDRNGVIVAVNAHWRNFASESGIDLGMPTPNTGVGANYLQVSQQGGSSSAPEIDEAVDGVRAVLEGRLQTFRLEYLCSVAPPERWFRMVVTPLGTAVAGGAVVTHTDISERKQLEQAVRQLAFNDVLTELPNRRLLVDRLNQALSASKRSGRFGAVVFLDLDNFKSLNDNHGHEAGDALLQEVGRRLTACVRAVDTVARFGGDEFVVLLGDLSTEQADSQAQAAGIAEKIRARLAEPYRLHLAADAGQMTLVEHRCSASMGVVLFGSRNTSHVAILKWADAAMYQAKDAGRNVVRFSQGESD